MHVDKMLNVSLNGVHIVVLIKCAYFGQHTVLSIRLGDIQFDQHKFKRNLDPSKFCYNFLLGLWGYLQFFPIHNFQNNLSFANWFIVANFVGVQMLLPFSPVQRS